MRIAVVRNDDTDGVIAHSDQPSPERYGRRTVRAVVEALRAGRHFVAEIEGDVTMFAALQDFLADSDPIHGDVLVLNMAYGVQGEARYTHVPAMLELAGVPYTGAGPLGHSICLDKVVAKVLMVDAGIPTPAYTVMSAPGSELGALRFPLIVKPRRESTSNGLALVDDCGGLDDAVASIVVTYRQDALVEEYVYGREVCVGLLGNYPPLPTRGATRAGTGRNRPGLAPSGVQPSNRTVRFLT